MCNLYRYPLGTYQKVANPALPASNRPIAALTLEAVRSALWREPERLGEHFSQSLPTVFDVLGQQRAPAGDVLSYLRSMSFRSNRVV